MARPFDGSQQRGTTPFFEQLEDRLLLTTIRGGESFIYLNSQRDTVNIYLDGESTDVIEVFAHNLEFQDQFGLVDLPGFYLGNPDPDSAVSWPAGEPATRADDDVDGLYWNARGDERTLEDGSIATAQYGPEAEIYAIYVVSASPNASLTIAKVNGVDVDRNLLDPTIDWFSFDWWGGNAINLPITHTGPPPVTPAPDGSGQVLIGASHVGYPNDGTAAGTWWGSQFASYDVTFNVPYQGVYPGTSGGYGALHAGITVSDDVFRMTSASSLGRAVESVSGARDGSIYAVDSNPFIGELINSTPQDGNIGGDIEGIATSSSGVSYVADDERPQILVDLNIVNGEHITVGEDLRVLAAYTTNGGDLHLYTIDEVTGQMIQIRPDQRRPQDRVRNIGQVVDSSGAGLSGFISLDAYPEYDSANPGAQRYLWALATGGQGYQILRGVPENRVQAEYDFRVRAEEVYADEDDGPWGPGVVPGIEAAAMGVDADGNTVMWAVTTGNELAIINPSSGLMTLAGIERVGSAVVDPADFELRDTAGNTVNEIVALDFIGGTLYATTSSQELLRILVDQVVVTSNICTNLGTFQAPTAESLAYVGSRPGRVYTLGEVGGINRLVEVPVKATLVRVDTSGLPTVVAPLWDATSARSVLTFSGQPSDGQTIGIDDAFGNVAYFEFDNNATINGALATGVTIGATLTQTLDSLRTAVNASNLDMSATVFAATGTVVLTHTQPVGGNRATIASDVTVLTTTGFSGSEDTYAFQNVAGLEFAPTDPTNPFSTSQTLYGLTTVVGLDPVGVAEPRAGMWLVTINPSTGAVNRLANITGPNDLASLANYVPDSVLDNVFYAADPDNHQFYIVNEGEAFLSGGEYVLDRTGRVEYSVAGTPPSDVASGDVTNDGVSDLVMPNGTTDEVVILPGVGDGTFDVGSLATLAVGNNPVAVTLADLNGDASLDIVVVNQDDDDITVYLADGAGGFGGRTDFAVGDAPTSVAAGNVSNLDDANVDLVVTNEGDNNVSVLLGNGAGGFAAAGTYAVVGLPQDVELGQTNDDNDDDAVNASDYLDIVTANGMESGTVSVLMGDGHGVFMEYEQYVPDSVWMADLNGDGFEDIVVANSAGNTVSVLLHDGAGGFEGRWTYDTGDVPVAVTVADVNSDGDLDIITANRGVVGAANGTISVLLGNGTGVFTTLGAQAVGPEPVALAAGQINGAGGIDLVVANRQDGTVTVLFGNNNGTFTAQPAINVGNVPVAVHLTDLNNDLDLDVVAANSLDDTITVLLNDGGGTFTEAADSPFDAGGVRPVALASADFDGDGAQDMAVVNQQPGDIGTVSILLGGGNGGLSAATAYEAGPGASAIALGLLDAGDTALDLVVTSQTTDSVAVLLGDGAGGFVAATADSTYPVGPSPRGVFISSVNGTVDGLGNYRLDNFADVIAVNRDDDSVTVLLGEGDGTLDDGEIFPDHEQDYTLRNWFQAGAYTSGVAVGDVDGNGDVDIVASNAGDPVVTGDGSISVLIGRGAGTFVDSTVVTTYEMGEAPEAVVLADINTDGNLDAFTANYDSDTFSMRLGIGDGTFQDPADLSWHRVFPVGTPPLAQPSALVVADLDADGALDVAVANTGSQDVSVLLGNGDGSFGGDIQIVDENGVPYPANPALDPGDPFVGVEWAEVGGTYALFGVTANTYEPETLPGVFNPSDSSLYVMDVDAAAGTATFRLLGQVTRYDPSLPASAASLTSLSYFPERPGYLWTTDRVMRFVDEFGVPVPDGSVYIDENGVGHQGGRNGDVLQKIDMGFRLSSIRLSSALVVSDDAGNVGVQTLLFDSDTVGHPFWIYENVTATDFDHSETLYAVATLRSLVPDSDPVVPGDPLATQTWLVTIEEGFSPLDAVNVVTRVAQLTTDDSGNDVTGVESITFADDGTLYGVDAGSGELFTFDVAAGVFTGAVTDVGPLATGITGLDFQADYVTQLPGFGDGAFAPPETFSVGNGPSLAPLTDLNGDGYNDILTANEYDDTVSVILSETDFFGNFIGFLPEATYPVGEPGTQHGPVAVATGRLNPGASPDVVVANRDSDTVTVIFNSNTGVLQAGLYNPEAFIYAQINDDDDDGLTGPLDFPDIVTVNPEDDTIAIFLGVGDGTFSGVPIVYDVGNSPQAVEAEDFTDDGITDLVVVNQLDSTVSILQGFGNGEFWPLGTYGVGMYPQDVIVSDLDGDTILDIVSINVGSGSASILMGQGMGTFQLHQNAPEVNVGYRPLAGELGDVDRDGALDLVVANRLGTVSVLLGDGDGTFQALSAFETGRQPESLVLVQLTDDGAQDGVVDDTDFLDIVTTGFLDNTVSVLVGDGDGAFAAPLTYAVGEGPVAVSTTQLNDDNGDGLVDLFDNRDLVVANSNPNDEVGGDTVTLLLGNGDGTFGLQDRYDVGTAPEGVAVGDFDGDGIEDLAVANRDSGDVTVLLGAADGTFTAQAPTYAVGTEPIAIVAGLFDADAVLDLAVANQGSDDVSVLVGNGDGTFAAAVAYAVGDGPAAMASGDLNNDGEVDLAVANSLDDTVSILLGVGDGTFVAQAPVAVGTTPQALAVAFLDADANADLAVVNGGSDDVSILLGDGAGGFAAHPTEPLVTVGTAPSAILAADLDGSGQVDLAVANSGTDDVSVLLGVGDGTFAAAADYDAGSGPSAVILSDFDGDGNSDLAVTSGTGADVRILAGAGDGTFTLAGAGNMTGLLPGALAASDFDDDGALDLVTANAGSDDLSVMTGNGDGTFVTQLSEPTGDGPSDVRFVDVNLDAVPDILVTNYDGQTMTVLLADDVDLDGVWDGTFTAQDPFNIGFDPIVTAVGDEPVDVVVADFNADRLFDVAVANQADDTVWVMLGDGTGAFPTITVLGVGDQPTDLAVGDINWDGRRDLAVVTAGDDRVTVFQGNGDGTFGAGASYAVGDQPTDVVLADMNGDERLDLLVTTADDRTPNANSPNPSVYFLTGQPGGTFAFQATLALIDTPQSLDVDDLDGDGDLDIVVTSETGNSVTVLIGNGDGFFLGGTTYDVEFGPRTVALGDIDDDGISDIVLANRDDRLFGAAPGALFTVDPATASLTPVAGLSGTFTDLGANMEDPTFLWGVAEFGNSFGGVPVRNYYLTQVYTSQENAIQDMGQVVVGGTISGWTGNEGNIDLLRMGFLWGDVNVGRNLGNLIFEMGGGAVPPAYYPEDFFGFPRSHVYVRGVLGSVYTMGGTMYSTFEVDYDTSVPRSRAAVVEMEGTVPGGWDNHTMEHAQFLSHPTGKIAVDGALFNATPPNIEPTHTLPEYIGKDTGDFAQDWYAVPLRAGQTLTVNAWVPSPWQPIPLLLSSLSIHLHNSEGLWMDSLGYETVDDYGVGSRWRWDTEYILDEQKPITFTAPAAGVYYLTVITPPNSGDYYHMEISGMATDVALGAMSFDGDLSPAFHYILPPEEPLIAHQALVRNGGSIGAIQIRGGVGGHYHTFGCGDIISFEGGTINGATVIAEGAIGRIGSMTGGMVVYVESGFSNRDGLDGPYDWDAAIDNIFSAGTVGGNPLFPTMFVATGSVGAIEVGGDMLADLVEVNSDDNGPAGNMDLITVAGNWGSPLIVPVLHRGAQGNVGYVHVVGDVWAKNGEWVQEATEHTFTMGQSSTVYDDSGGRLTIVPGIKADADGNPVLDDDGNETPTTYSYVIIGVDDFDNPGSGDGGAITKLRIDGPATLAAIGEVKVGDLDLTYTQGDVTSQNLNVSGSGTFNVYYAHSDAEYHNYLNYTKGDLISGTFAGINRLVTGGSIGAQVGTVGAWVHGFEDAPVSASPMDEPQYGWHRDKINGVNIVGADTVVQEITAGGFIRDVRAEGELGNIWANADGLTPRGQWHGVNGIIWSAVRIDSVAVGDGLADDGPVSKAKAAILSTFTIGAVTISGPRYVGADGVVYGEINGSIFGLENDEVPAEEAQADPGGTGATISDNPWTISGSTIGGDMTPNLAWIIGAGQQPVTTPGTTAQPDMIERLAVGQIIGTNGAQLTALAGGSTLDSFYCFVGAFGRGEPPVGGPYSGVGTIRFSGSHALIHGFEVFADYVKEVTAASGTDGMVNSYISGNAAPPDTRSVGRVGAGGPGMDWVYISADGGDVGTIAGLDAQSDIAASKFIVTDGGIASVSARDIVESHIHAVEDIGSVTVRRDMLDMVQVSGFDQTSILYNSFPAGTFLEAVTNEGGRWPRALATGDLNNDGYPDIITVNEHVLDPNFGMLTDYVSVLLSDGYGGYAFLPDWYIAEDGPRSIAVADLDGDANLDVIVGNYNDNSVTTFFGDGAGVLGDKRVYLVGERPTSVTVGDVDGDGVLDVVTTNFGTDDLSLLIGRGNGVLEDEERFTAGSEPTDVVLADMDNDGDTDIVVANKLDDNIMVLLNDGTPFYSTWEQETFDTGSAPVAIALGHLDDFNGDLAVTAADHLDIVVANRDERKVSVLLGQDMADLDGDGDLDLVFADQQKIGIRFNPGEIALADLDGNGALDIISSNAASELVSILYGNVDANFLPDATFAEETTEESAANVQDFEAVDTNLDGLLDIVAANKGPGGPGLFAGAIGTFSVARNISDSHLRVASTINTMTVGENFDNTILDLPGDAADLRSLSVGNDISGSIRSAGSLGSIVSGGAIFADIATTADPDSPSNDVDLIRTQDGYWGGLDVAGSLGRFECNTSLGLDPREEPIPQHLLVAGDLGTLRVASRRGAPASDLLADLSVGGNVGTIDVDGTLYGDLVVHGNANRLQFDGNLGAVEADGTRYGSVDVLGEIKRLNFARQGDLVADITTGASLQKISITGDLLGNLTSRYGDILGVTVTNGELSGSITGRSVGTIAVKNGDLTGDIRATNGNIKKVQVTNGDLLAHVSATHGRVDQIRVANGDFGSATEKFVASADRGFKQIQVGGNMYADVESEGMVDLLNISGNRNADGDLINAFVSADAGIKRATIRGDMDGSTLRGGLAIDNVTIRGDMTNGSRISSGWDVGTLNIRGNVDGGSSIRAGWDVGGATGSVLLSQNTAGGTVDPFYQNALVSAGDTPVDAVLADLNGDGADDVVIVNSGSDDVTVRLNNIDGTFGPHVRYAVGTTPMGAAVGDVNGDGALDIVVANSGDDTISFLLGRGDGTFYQDDDPTTPGVLDDDPTTPEVPFLAVGGTGPAFVALGQFDDNDFSGMVDADDDLDIFVGSPGDDSVSLFLSDGQGAFTQFITMVFPDTLVDVLMTDVNDDPDPAVDGGDELIVLLGGASDSVGIMPNPAGPGIPLIWGTGEFAITAAGLDPVDIAAGDLDGDLYTDLAVANQGDNTVGVFINDGTGAFAAMVPYATGTTPEAIAIALFNDDTFLDVATINSGSDDVSLLTNNGAGALAAPDNTATWESPIAFAVGQIDTNDTADAVVLHDTIQSNPMGGGQVHAGSIKSLTIGGDFDTAVVSAGIDPTDGSSAPGYSVIKRMNVRGNIVDAAGSAILADSEIDTRFVQRELDTQVWANLQYTQNFAPAVPGGPYTADHFGPTIGNRTADRQWINAGAGLTIQLSGGREGLAHYDEATRTLTLIRTTAQSTLTIRLARNAPAYPGVINIVGAGADGDLGGGDDGPATDDSSLATLRVIGDVTIGTLNVDGEVKNILVESVSNGTAWDLPGGVRNARINQDVTNLTVNTGEVRTWNMRGAYTGGTFLADSVRTFQTRGAVTADVGADMGELRTFRVQGDYSGTTDVFADIYTMDVRGTFSGEVNVACGDLRTMRVDQHFTGTVDVALGESRSVTVRQGDFAEGAVYDAATGIGTFTVSRGSFEGMLNTDGNLKTVNVPRGEMTGRIRSAGSITRATFGSMSGAVLAAGNDLSFVTIKGDMEASSIFAGFDPGYDANPSAAANYNIQIDALTPTIWRTAGNDDQARGGRIKRVTVHGQMSPEYNATLQDWDPNSRGSTIAAGIDPGLDGYVGTNDDIVRGTGVVDRVVVYEGIWGNSVQTQSYGVFAASEMPTVYFWRNKVFQEQLNASTGIVSPSVGSLVVEDVIVQARSLIVRFNHAVNMGTINTRQRYPDLPTTFSIYDASNEVISDTVANQIAWDPTDFLVTFTLTGTNSWANLNGPFVLVLDGSRVADPRGGLLDGNGDGTPGDDYTVFFFG